MSTLIQKFHLVNLDCADCAARIEAGVKQLPGVKFASVNFATATLHLDTSDISSVIKLIKKLEPDVSMVSAQPEEHTLKIQVRRELSIIIAAIALFVLGMIFRTDLQATRFGVGEYIVFGTAYLLSGWGVLKNALRNILNRNWFDETFLMSIATIGAFMIRELPEAVGVMLFYKVGEFLQDLSVNRSRRSIQALLELRPDSATLKVDGELRKVSPAEVKVGETIVIRPGEKVPLDGVILDGNSQVDTSTLTGESVPRSVRTGDPLLAGMINQTGLVTIEVTRLIEESTISKMLELVQNAANHKARTEKFITRFANYYTPMVVFGALGVAVLPPLFITGATFSEWIYRALVLLVISCPCALMISIPLGYFGGIGGASRRGILIKGANFLDVLADVKTVIFDKTGTLTKGVFKVTEIEPRNGYNQNDLLRIANEAEAESNHPIAQSIREAIGNGEVSGDLESFQEIAGLGVDAMIDGRKVLVGNDTLLHRENIPHEDCEVGGTAVHVAVDGNYVGYLVISDEIKPHAVESIQELRKAGVEDIVMLTGDRRNVAAHFADELGVDHFHAELLPEDKVSALETLMEQSNGGKVAFVGDGVNDAPGIARADVGIAMGSLGSDAAIETADVVLMTDSPTKVVEAIAVGRRTRRIVWQNIILALAVKTVFVIIGVGGLASMWQAVFADVGVTLVAVLNASRVLHT